MIEESQRGHVLIRAERSNIVNMAEPGVERLISFDRYSSYLSLVPVILYMPLGLALGLVRLCIFLHACLLSYVLPNSFPFKRIILRTMLSVTGLPLSTQGVIHNDDKTKILVANHVTNLDPFILALLHPNILVIEGSGLPHFHPKRRKRFELPADKDREDLLISLKEKVRESEEPLLFFPEKLKTNGKNSLLKFSHLPFSVGNPIQPVAIQVQRYLFDISVSTYTSSAYEDLVWCLVLPLTLFKIKYLPVTERKRDESSEEFASRVQSNMAKSMGITASSHSHYDVIEFVKEKSMKQKSESITVKKKTEVKEPQPQAIARQPPAKAKAGDPELEKMVQQVKDVLPDTPAQCILSDLQKTRDVDATITNILEGRVDTKPQGDGGVSLNSLSEGISFKASKFEMSASARQLSFAERKQAMLEAARLKYRIKHGL